VGILAMVGYVGTSPAAADGPIVTGGGSSFVSLMVSQWRADVAKPPYNLKVNYTSAGSGFGRDKYSSGALDFGQSDISYLPEELPAAQKRGPFVYVPVAAGALAFMFNVVGTDGRRITNLKLTADTACKLFTVPDIKWNDPAIAATNAGIPLPDHKVRPVVRSDRSGTSYVLSEFCIARAGGVWNQFKSFITAGNFGQDQYLGQGQPISQWPSGYGAVSQAFASDGIANATGANADSVTYIETGYTKVKGLPAALVQNAVGAFTPPNPANSTVALGFATPNGNGTFKLSYNGADPRAYFPSTYSYTIAQTTGFDPAKGAVLSRYLNYAVCKGQDRAEPLLYSRLSVQLVDIALDATAKIPGAPPRPATASCGAPPPPVLKTVTPGSGAGAAGAKAGAAGSAAGAAGAGAAGATAAGAGAATDPAAAAAAAAAADQAAATAGDAATGDAATGDAAAGGTGSASGDAVNPVSTTAGPENSDVLFTLLLGAALVGIGTFVAKGTRSSWQK
jgi:phosphate transport system substrate-binding protein